MMRDKIKKGALALICFAICCMGFSVAAGAKNLVVVIDPGHGRSETGATRTFNGVTYREEVVNLAIARYMKAELQTYSGVTVYMTHNSLTGSYMDRAQRVAIAQKRKADVLISIHNNSTGAASQTIATGSYALVPTQGKYPNSLAYAKKTRKLGAAILKELSAQVGLKNNGYGYDDDLGIIKYGMAAKIPSMIIEHCYVNNPNDCTKYLKTNSQLKKMGVADATAVAKYYKLSKKTDTDTNTTKKNGWVTVSNRKYYYVDDVKVVSQWKKINGKYYYFSKYGILKTGVFKISKTYYLSNANGVRQKGLVTYQGKKYYAVKGKIYTGWKTIGNKKYYFDPEEKGAAATGWKTIDGNKYYFDTETAAMKTKWVTVSGKKYWLRMSDGVMLKKRWLSLNKKWYYLTAKGYAYRNTTKKINGVEYTFDSQGVCTNK